jgi:hypothetical protein
MEAEGRRGDYDEFNNLCSASLSNSVFTSQARCTISVTTASVRPNIFSQAEQRKIDSGAKAASIANSYPHPTHRNAIEPTSEADAEFGIRQKSGTPASLTTRWLT